MKNYTVIYGEFINCGSRTVQLVKYQHVSCKPDESKEVVERIIGFDCVHYIFDGHVEQTLD